MDELPLDYIRQMKWRTTKPFRPFAFVLRSGRRVDVLKATWFGGSESEIGVYHPHSGLHHLDAQDVKAIRPLTDQEAEAAAVFLQ